MTELPDGKLSIAMSQLFKADQKARSDNQINVTKEVRYNDYKQPTIYIPYIDTPAASAFGCVF
ncbi:hypothetical protein [Planococcus salinus]|uniref:Uncharacterized protein n=1 Tax=Planococcus salinus TaxID=1848460 RepID=A0A3M8P5C1_9BACL|nr:hypothetical protein [Planococcus salinus]RNF38867.1 hypothetical protein EEX84_12165 [Planococcus salinus]